MAKDTHDTHATVGVESHDDGHGEFNPLEVSGSMVLWTWVTFGLVLLVLHKYAWKPILKGLDEREAKITKSIADAEEVKERLADIKGTQDQMIAEADTKAKGIIIEAREAAGHLAQTIEAKANDEAAITKENAQRELHASQERAHASLKRESAEMAVAMAGKLLREKLTPDADAKLVDRLIQDV